MNRAISISTKLIRENTTKCECYCKIKNLTWLQELNNVKNYQNKGSHKHGFHIYLSSLDENRSVAVPVEGIDLAVVVGIQRITSSLRLHFRLFCTNHTRPHYLDLQWQWCLNLQSVLKAHGFLLGNASAKYLSETFSNNKIFCGLHNIDDTIGRSMLS